jgi:hypothetical protein
MKTPTQQREFLRAFGESTGLTTWNDYDAQWAAWSRQLSDTERAAIEAGGEESGRAEAAAYVAAHPCD